MSRKEVSFSKGNRREISLTEFNKFEPILYNNLYVPSYVHSYSLAIEYMKKWFLEKFNDNYFKYVHLNVKHMFDDYKHFNNQNIKREKPLAIITPNIDHDYDRENLDLYNAGADIFLKRSDYQRSFFQDRDHNSYLGFQMKELKMNFNFRVKLSTRAQQLDLLEKMNLRFRIGGSQTEFISADFLLPKDLLLNLANDNGFEIINGEIKDPTLFLQYLNSHSSIPISYKLRSINNKLEYFMRLQDVCCNIWTSDKLDPDDGEREGMIDNNFNIDMQASLRIAVPHFFIYFNEKPLNYKLSEDKATIGFYTLSQFVIQPKNENEWDTFINTTYQADKYEKTIDMIEVLKGTNLEKVIEDSKSKFISPKSFIDIKVYHELGGEYPLIYSDMDYNTYKLNVQPFDQSEYLYIVIYVDKLYMNEQLLSIEQLNGRTSN